MTFTAQRSDQDEWWRRRLGRLVLGEDEAVVRALLSRRSARRPVGQAAVRWRAWSVEKDWRHSNGPQVIVKAAGRRKSAYGVKVCIRYMARLRPRDGQAVPVRDEFGRQVDPVLAVAEWDLLPDRENLSTRARMHPENQPVLPVAERLYHVQAHHFVISAGVPAKDVAAGQAFQRALHVGIDQLFAAEGFRVLWAVHEDTDHVHAHVLVQALSRFGRRLRLDIGGEAFDHMRQVFAEALNRSGIPAQAVRREDRSGLRARIMAGQARLRWPKRPGNGDLAERAPAWFWRHGPDLVQRQQMPHRPPVKQSWWRALFRSRAPASIRPPAVPTEAAAAVTAFGVVFEEPILALVRWRQLAAGEGGQSNLALARWYLMRQPGIFGAARVHDDVDRRTALESAGKLPLLPPLPPVPPREVAVWADQHRAMRRVGLAKHQRNEVLKTLWKLARRVLDQGNPAQARVVLSKALSSLWIRPAEPEAAPPVLDGQPTPVPEPSAAGAGVASPKLEAALRDAALVPQLPRPLPASVLRKRSRSLGT